MRYMAAAATDAGVRKINQDSLLIRVAESGRGPVALAVLCDGVGGLDRGEIASAALVDVFGRWFGEELPAMLAQEEFGMPVLRGRWETLIRDAGRRLSEFGARNRLRLGTTLSALLLAEGRYYIANVGDTRVYRITDRAVQLTVDQTCVQREVSLGHMTEREAASDPRGHVLLQCVGAGPPAAADYCEGDVQGDTVFMLCCDGFRHRVTAEEFAGALNPGVLDCEEKMEEQAQRLIRLNLDRGETDNITVGLLRSCQGGENA